MNKKLMAMMATMFAFAFAAKAESMMDLSIKVQSSAYNLSKYMYSTNESKVNATEAGSTELYTYTDNTMAGFVNGNLGLTVDGIFNVGYGIGLGFGVGAYANYLDFSNITASYYDKDGKVEESFWKAGAYKATSTERKALLQKASHMTIVPQAVVKYTFVELEPVSFYAIVKGGYSLPIALWGEIKYDDKADSETVANNWMNYHASAGLGINWIGIEFAVMYTRSSNNWNVIQKEDSYSYKLENGVPTTEQDKASDPQSKKDATRTEGMVTNAVSIELGYTLGLF